MCVCCVCEKSCAHCRSPREKNIYIYSLKGFKRNIRQKKKNLIWFVSFKEPEFRNVLPVNSIADPVAFMVNFPNFRLGQVSHVKLSRYIWGEGRRIGGGVHVNHDYRMANLLIFIDNGGI